MIKKILVMVLMIGLLGSLAFGIGINTGDMYEIKLYNGKDIINIGIRMHGRGIETCWIEGLDFPKEFPWEKIIEYNGQLVDLFDGTSVIILNYWFSDEEHTRITVSFDYIQFKDIDSTYANSPLNGLQVGVALQTHSDQGMILFHKSYLVDIRKVPKGQRWPLEKLYLLRG